MNHQVNKRSKSGRKMESPKLLSDNSEINRSMDHTKGLYPSVMSLDRQNPSPPKYSLPPYVPPTAPYQDDDFMGDIQYSESSMCKPTIHNSGITQLRFISKLKEYKTQGMELEIVLRGLIEYLDSNKGQHSINSYALVYIFKDERYTDTKVNLSTRYDEFISMVSKSKSEGWTMISEYVENLP